MIVCVHGMCMCVCLLCVLRVWCEGGVSMCLDVRLEGVAVSMYLSFALFGACLFCCEGLGGPVMAPPAFNCWRLGGRSVCMCMCMYMYVWGEGKGVH